jgi:tRNA threonylcarbamoyladenosine biosynthesis protein TsaB
MILGIDTATPSTVAAFGRRSAAHHPAPGERPGHAERLLGLIAEVMGDTDWSEIEKIAVGVGPGGFTGLRIGIATARGLAQAHGIPVAPVSTLEALAKAAEGDRDIVLAVIDARRKEVFAAAWQGDTLVLPPEAIKPAELARRIGRLRPLAVGNGAQLYRAQLEAAGAVVPTAAGPHRVDGTLIARLAGNPVPLDQLLPDYIRDPDAKPRDRQ